MEFAGTYGDKVIQSAAIAPLELWKNDHSDNDYLIHIEHPEFTALCPRSGYPDFGTIVIDYYPGDFVVELKAIKLYINSFRQERISHESAVNTIANRLFTDVQPKTVRVIGDFMRRGNIKTIITVIKGSSTLEFPFYSHNIL